VSDCPICRTPFEANLGTYGPACYCAYGVRPESVSADVHARVHAEAPGGGEIEVTPEMIEAGADILRLEAVCGDSDHRSLASAIYLAMERARRR
jgi:hypothetical protein